MHNSWKLMMQRPSQFFLAVVALFGVKQCGQGLVTWQELWCRSFNWGFRSSISSKFSSSSATYISRYRTTKIRMRIRWWIVSLRTFKQVGVVEQFADFSAFFTALYSTLLLVNPGLFIRCSPSFRTLAAVGIELGVLSNFDSRLYSVLSIELRQFSPLLLFLQR